MGIKVTSRGASFSKPGVYPNIQVLNLSGFPLLPTGTVCVIGEAVGGEPSVLDVMEGPAMQAGKLRYKSGPIADSIGILTAPSKDPRVPNGASKIVAIKVNQSTQSVKNLLTNKAGAATLVALKSKNWGADENNDSVKLTAGSDLDSNALIAGTIAGPFNLAGGETLILVSNGSTYTFTNTVVGATVTAAALVAELQTAARWSGSVKPVVASLVTGTQRIQILLDSAVVVGGELEYGFLSVTPSSTLDTIVGITGTGRGVRGSRFVIFKKGSLEETTLPEIGGVAVLSVRYTGAGTDSLLSIKDVSTQRKLTSTCTGAVGDALNIVLGEVNADSVMVAKMTVRELIDLLNATGVYVATSTFSNLDIPATDLDFYDAMHVETAAAPIYRDIEDFVDIVNVLSTISGATRQSNVYGTLVTVVTASLFTGGTDGTASGSDWANAFELAKQIRCNIVVPLISADKGSVTIDTVHALLDSHMQWAWSAEGRSPRNGYASFLGSKTATKAAAKALNSGYTSLVAGDAKVFSFSQSATAYLDPWASACVVAGMQAGSDVGEPTTFKVANVTAIRVRDKSWDPKVHFTEMIDAGVTFLEPMDEGGFRIVCGNTTYGKDASFVYNRVSVVEAAGFVYYDLVKNLEAIFTGTKAKTGSATALANFTTSRMETYLHADIIVGDDLNKGLGFKDLSVAIGANGNSGNTATIDVTITPVQGLDFILPSIYLADIQQSA